MNFIQTMLGRLLLMIICLGGRFSHEYISVMNVTVLLCITIRPHGQSQHCHYEFFTKLHIKNDTHSCTHIKN